MDERLGLFTGLTAGQQQQNRNTHIEEAHQDKNNAYYHTLYDHFYEEYVSVCDDRDRLADMVGDFIATAIYAVDDRGFSPEDLEPVKRISKEI